MNGRALLLENTARSYSRCALVVGLEPGDEIFGSRGEVEARRVAQVLDEAPVRKPRARSWSERHDVASFVRFAPAEFREAFLEELAPCRQRPRGDRAEV